MFRSLSTAATGMAAEQSRIDVIAHNMANVETTGFRRLHAEFRDLVYSTLRAPGGRTAQGGAVPTGVMIGTGTVLSSTQLSMQEGSIAATGSPLDLAIEGRGFFQLLRPDGTLAYTRNGNFQLDPEGRLVTPEGLPVEPAISVPQGVTSLTISSDGVITATLPGSGESQEIGRLELATFPNPGGLEPMGRNLYRATTASGPVLTAAPGNEGLGTISQGMLEGSNVEIVNEMIDLISSQRAYELNHRVVQAADEMLRKSSEL
jgi:flagellar basal-body rod protein FlgG